MESAVADVNRLPDEELERDDVEESLPPRRRRELVLDGWIRVFAAEWASRRPEAQKLQERSGASLRK